MRSTRAKKNQNNRTSCNKGTPKLITRKYSEWICSCGHRIPKKDAELSGYASGSQGFHVHCPRCGKVVAQFINPK